MPVKLYIRKLRPEAVLPRYATEGAAAMDLFACLDAPLVLEPGARVSVPTGLSAAPPSPEWVLLLCARSGLAFSQGITLVNSVGVIDADYRGEICVGLIHHGDTPYGIEPGDRIAQLMLLPVARAQPVEVDALPDTERGVGGFGSTGR